ncbi:MAG: glyoxylase I family protein [Gammaproteobacteria bacterium]|jgi:glyoxylase I family protein
MNTSINVQGLHHVAHRCKDAQTTVDFYSSLLDLECTLGVAENRVPSTGEFSPHIHVVFKMGDGLYLAFLELAQSPHMALDANTPDWVQYLALRVDRMEKLVGYKERLEAAGLEAVGPVEHKICQSICFFDPDGQPMELTLATSTPALDAKLYEMSGPLLREWNRTKRAPEFGFMHDHLASERGK